MAARGSMIGMVSKEKPGCDPVEGETLPRICSFDNGSDLGFKDTECKGIYDLFARGTKLNPDGNCLGFRPLENGVVGPFEWMDYKTVKGHVVAIGSALVEQFGLSKGGRVGIMGKNCPCWSMVELAASSQALVGVPLYDTLGENSVEYVINHAELSVVCCAVENAEAIVNVKKSGACPSLKHIVIFGNKDLESGEAAAHPAVVSGDAMTLAKLRSCGSDDDSKVARGSTEDLFVIMYTSGTTGDPKGVMLPNRCILADVFGADRFFAHFGFPFLKSDVLLSFLPLAHIFEQIAEANIFAVGGAVGYYQGDPRKLVDDLAALQPTIFIGVPRVYARFQQKIEETRDKMTGLKARLFDIAFNSALRAEQNLTGRNFLWDLLVMNKVKAKIFPRVRYMISGSAPLSKTTNDFLKACLNVPLVQGYGLTESTGGFVCSALNNSVSGHCGGPLPGAEMKLRDVPDMDYLTTDKPYPRGEVLLRGDLIFSGYFKNEEETRKTLDSDGWFATGDIGQFLEDGALQIIDRKKNMFKLSQGEYVSPEKLENEYAKCKLISQIWVYGSSFENYLVAVVVPDLIHAPLWAASKGLDTEDLASIVATDGFKEAVMEEMKAMKTTAKFKGYEEIKDVVFETSVNDLGQGFTVDNETLTPTFKYKRPALVKKYKDQIDAMYAKMKN